MNKPDREDAVARALDILPPGDPAASDPRLLRDAALQAEARAARETAADLWLAVSPLCAAPPDVLHSVMDKIGAAPAAPESLRRLRLAPLLAASGWAAAAAVTICLWPRNPGAERAPAIATAPVEPPAKSGNRGGKNTAGPLDAVAARNQQWQQRVDQLRNKMEVLRHDDWASMPRVMDLSAPGAVQRSPEEARQRVFDILVNALRNSLEIASGAPGDPADFVIERGWIPQSLDLPTEDLVLRHRNFPEASWAELGLRRSDEGSYYDPARQFVWAPDAQRGGFIGRMAPADFDPSAYKEPTPDQTAAIAKLTQPSDPEGFVIEDPVTRKAEVVIDRVQPPKDGYTHQIHWTDASGASGTIPVQSGSTTMSAGVSGAIYLVGSDGQPFAITPGFWGQGGIVGQNVLGTFYNSSGLIPATVVANFSTTAAVTSFELVETPIVQDGQPVNSGKPRVIVQGGQGGRGGR